MAQAQVRFVENPHGGNVVFIEKTDLGGNWRRPQWWLYASHASTMTHGQFEFLKSLTGQVFSLDANVIDNVYDNDVRSWTALYEAIKAMQAPMLKLVTIRRVIPRPDFLIADNIGIIFKEESTGEVWNIAQGAINRHSLPDTLTIPEWLWNARTAVTPVDHTSNAQQAWAAVVAQYIKTHAPKPPVIRLEWTVDSDGDLKCVKFVDGDEDDSSYANDSHLTKVRELFAYFITNQPQPTDEAQADRWLELVNNEQVHALWYEIAQPTATR